MWLRGGCNHHSSHLSEEPPPLPVSQLQISSTVSLENFKGTQLLLLLSKGPKWKRKFGVTKFLTYLAFKVNTRKYKTLYIKWLCKLSFIFNWTAGLPENVDHLYLFIIVISNNSGFKVTFFLQLWGHKLMPEKWSKSDTHLRAKYPRHTDWK